MYRVTTPGTASHSPDQVSRRIEFRAPASKESSASSPRHWRTRRRMNKQVILLADAETAPAIELLESLSAAGISVLAHNLTETQGRAEEHPERSLCPLAVLYEIPPRANPQDLSLVVSRANELWPGVAIVACRRAPAPPSLDGPVRPDNQALKLLGFRAIADS